MRQTAMAAKLHLYSYAFPDNQFWNARIISLNVPYKNLIKRMRNKIFCIPFIFTELNIFIQNHCFNMALTKIWAIYAKTAADSTKLGVRL